MKDKTIIQRWITTYQLEPHPEGGYFYQQEKSETVIPFQGKDCPLYTSIYFVLTEDSPSRFHRLSHDELWFFHSGNPIVIHSIDNNGVYHFTELGKETFQTTVPAGHIFASSVENGQSLVSCVVVPGFSYSDFELFSKEDLLKNYPQHHEIIDRLAYSEEELSRLAPKND